MELINKNMYIQMGFVFAVSECAKQLQGRVGRYRFLPYPAELARYAATKEIDLNAAYQDQSISGVIKEKFIGSQNWSEIKTKPADFYKHQLLCKIVAVAISALSHIIILSVIAGHSNLWIRCSLDFIPLISQIVHGIYAHCMGVSEQSERIWDVFDECLDYLGTANQVLRGYYIYNSFKTAAALGLLPVISTLPNKYIYKMLIEQELTSPLSARKDFMKNYSIGSSFAAWSPRWDIKWFFSQGTQQNYYGHLTDTKIFTEELAYKVPNSIREALYPPPPPPITISLSPLPPPPQTGQVGVSLPLGQDGYSGPSYRPTSYRGPTAQQLAPLPPEAL